MKPTEAQKREIRKYIKKWRGRLFLGEWFIDVRYASHDLCGHSSDGGQVLAEVASDPTYLAATITIYPCFWTRSREKREHALVHELSHCVSQELFEALIDAVSGKLITESHGRAINERLTQRIANICYQQEWS